MILEGGSWSGRERNNCYVNLGDGTFADVSALTDLDFDDDGRALAVVDWDHDGQLDLWIRNRTGPQLRFLHNVGTPGQNFFQLKLTGTTCNRDAIGAKVTVHAGEKKFMRILFAGEGNLAQSSKVLYFGLGDAERIDRVDIRWPDGKTQQLRGVKINRRYAVTQGEEEPELLPQRKIRLPDPPSPGDDPAATTAGARIVLRAPLDLPPSLTELAPTGESDGAPWLLNLWSHRCPGCQKELIEWNSAAKRLRDAGLKIATLCVDPEDQLDKAAKILRAKLDDAAVRDHFFEVTPAGHLLDTIEAIILHVRERRSAWPLPTSLLVDAEGRLQVIYLGSIDPNQLIEDVTTFCKGDVHPDKRTGFPGRWGTYLNRTLATEALAVELQSRGRFADAHFYQARLREHKLRNR